ncbi:MAG: hypothetical protein F6K17_42400 [Okeania sp. SIO3C4]|nr:hypothetical protein [Okeania sp. SIO3C4]
MWGGRETQRWGDEEMGKYLVIVKDGTFFYTDRTYAESLYLVGAPAEYAKQTADRPYRWCIILNFA